ncbi:hypothetical protein pb186bvf_020955 [Paramecium bursaria]
MHHQLESEELQRITLEYQFKNIILFYLKIQEMKYIYHQNLLICILKSILNRPDQQKQRKNFNIYVIISEIQFSQILFIINRLVALSPYMHKDNWQSVPLGVEIISFRIFKLNGALIYCQIFCNYDSAIQSIQKELIYQYQYQLNIYSSRLGACSSQKQDYSYFKVTTGKGCTFQVVKNITRIFKVNGAPHLLIIIHILKINTKLYVASCLNS